MAQGKDYLYLLESLMENDSFIAKRSFGGLFVYYEGKLVIVLMDDPSLDYRGKTYPFAPWDGVLIPTDKDYHAELKREYPFLKTQPFLQKWLMIPNSEHIEDQTEEIIKLVLSQDDRIGVYPKPRKPRSKKTVSKKK